MDTGFITNQGRASLSKVSLVVITTRKYIWGHLPFVRTGPQQQPVNNLNSMVIPNWELFLGKLTFLGRISLAIIISVWQNWYIPFFPLVSPVGQFRQMVSAYDLVCCCAFPVCTCIRAPRENLSIINISMTYLNQYCKNIQEHHQRDKSVFFCSQDSCNQQDKPCTLLIVLLHMLLQKQIEPVKSNLH